jgi:hypothetical protein
MSVDPQAQLQGFSAQRLDTTQGRFTRSMGAKRRFLSWPRARSKTDGTPLTWEGRRVVALGASRKSIRAKGR